MCESILTEEKRLHTAAQQEVLRLKQELEAFRDDSLQEKSSMLEQIKVIYNTEWNLSSVLGYFTHMYIVHVHV